MEFDAFVHAAALDERGLCRTCWVDEAVLDCLRPHGFLCACPPCKRAKDTVVLRAVDAAMKGDDSRLLGALGYKKERKRNKDGKVVDMWWHEE